MSFLLLLVFFSTQLEKRQNRFCLEAREAVGREMAQTIICTYE
jgi:hypothetical protein